MGNVRCSASDLRLRDCSFRGWGSYNCDHSDDVGVICGECNQLIAIIYKFNFI